MRVGFHLIILMISHTPIILRLLCTGGLLKTTKQASYPDKVQCKLSSAALTVLSLSIRSTTSELNLAILECSTISSQFK